jgi:plastocyanin
MRRTFSLLLAASLLLILAACSTNEAGGSPSASPSSLPASSAPAASPSAASPGAASPAASPEASGSAVEVVGVDYAFQGIPPTATVGTSFSLRNEGNEAHELVLVRKNPDVTLSFEELLELPEDQALNQVAFLGQVAANPGETASGTVTADAPGDYLAICFVPQGLTELPEGSLGPDASLPAGAPHFTLGMRQEFTVQ